MMNSLIYCHRKISKFNTQFTTLRSSRNSVKYNRFVVSNNRLNSDGNKIPSFPFIGSIRHVNHNFHSCRGNANSVRSSSYLKDLLYPDSDDEIINQLKTCNSVKDVMRILERNETLSSQQSSQAVLVLRDLQKLSDVKLTSFNAVMEKSNAAVMELYRLPSFQKLLSSIETNIEGMKTEEVTCCLLYLSKLNVDIGKSVMEKLINACEKKISCSSNECLSMADLARFFIVIKDHNNIWSLYTMNAFVPILFDRLGTCEDFNDFRHITICFQKCIPLLNSSHMDEYIRKIKILFKESDESNESNRMRTILKTVTFLGFRHWSGLYITEMKSLTQAMKGKLNYLCCEELCVLYKIVYSLQEPSFMLSEIKESANSELNVSTKLPGLPELSFQILFPGMKLQPPFVDRFREQIREFLPNTNCRIERISKNTNVLFLLNNTDLKFDKEITNAYWTMIANSFLSYNDDETLDDLLWIIHKYLYFLNTRNTHRSEFLEKTLLPRIVYFFHNNHKLNCSPSMYSKVAMTTLIFHKYPLQFFTENVLQKLLTCIPKLLVFDNLFISLSLREAFQRFRKRRRSLPTFLHYYVHLISATNLSTLNSLRRNNNIAMEKLNSMLFTHVLTKGIKTSEIFQRICEKLELVKTEELYSKVIRDSIYNFTVCNHLIPKYTDTIVEYCIGERDFIHANTVAGVLLYCFAFGFAPKRLNDFLDLAVTLIDRDRKYLSSYTFLRSVAAVSYFSEFPSSWSDYIFNVNFLEQLDRECNLLKFKEASALKNELMELNRVICIDYPSRDIPWFHEKYCQEQNTLELSKPGAFYNDVLNSLKTLVKIEEAIDTNHLSSYGHKIDILLYLDKNGKPINPRIYSPVEQRKIAINLHAGSLYSYFIGKGKLEIFVRQLEMLNYKVVLISKQQWDSMCLADFTSRTDYLKKLIWPK